MSLYRIPVLLFCSERTMLLSVYQPDSHQVLLRSDLSDPFHTFILSEVPTNYEP